MVTQVNRLAGVRTSLSATAQKFRKELDEFLLKLLSQERNATHLNMRQYTVTSHKGVFRNRQKLILQVRVTQIEFVGGFRFAANFLLFSISLMLKSAFSA